MKSTQDTAGRARVVVLDESVRNPTRLKGRLPKGLGEEASGVSVPRLLNQYEARELKLDKAERHGG